MAFEVEFVFLKPGDVEFLAGGSAFELAGNVLFVIADDSGGFFSGEGNRYTGKRMGKGGWPYFVIMPVVLTPSVLCVTRNLPFSLIGL